MTSNRREMIQQILRESGEVSLKTLATLFPDVSTMTLRRDLAFLEEQGVLIRTRGGAVSMQRLKMSEEDEYVKRATVNSEPKLIIARKAAQLAEPGRSLYLDSGTTIMSMAKALSDQNYSIITSGPNIALELARKLHPTITLAGGVLNRSTLSSSGQPALDVINRINIDIAFMGTSGLSLANGFTSGSFAECEVKHAAIQKARRVVFLMDRSKLDRTLPYTFANLQDVDTLVTDAPLPAEIAEAARQAGVKVI